MVAKKTAVQQSASGRSTGAAGATAKDVSGKKAVSGAAKKAVAKETAVKKAVAKKVTAEKATAKKAPAKKATAKKAVAKKASVKKMAAEKVTAKKSTAKETGPGEAAGEETVAPSEAETAHEPVTDPHAVAESAAKKSSPARRPAGGKKTTAKTSPPKKSTAKKSTAKKTVASAAEDAAEAAETTGATTVVAKKTPGTATAEAQSTAVPKARGAAAGPGGLAVRAGEDPWTPEEVAEARAELQSESLRLTAEIAASEKALAGLMRDSGDGAGDDEADTGTKNITREHEMSLAANAREMLDQTERALERLDAGTYGLCENCGNPIGKARMQAFPRATLCVECKQKQERRS
ncbi:TraR/DksA family transcriptional regulator [Streptomyces sp. NPDC023327]|uniref:TraR/DksA family transcriptional regulator n=1 Tax=Streptomyces sp. NPDC023327 TaxID=3157088 RepID=UPI0033C95163